MSRRVVITGIGIWSCLGTDIETVKEALYNGTSGIGLDEDRIAYGYRSGLVGKVAKPVITKKDIERHIRAGMSEEAEYAFMASRQAFGMAGMDDAWLMENEVGCIFGNDSSAKPVVESARIMDEKHDTEMLGYGLVFQSMNSTVNMNLSTIFHLRGINFTVSAACASGSHSIGLAYLLIKQGLQDTVLCGGAQETNYYSMASFDALRAFSTRMDEPTKASRPFDKDRDGLVPSGGAAALVLEEYEHAKARGANILCEVVGYGFSSNGGGISQPSDEGCVIAMTRAMEDAGLTPDDIDYVNAHATSTPQGDMFEAKALARLFEGKHALISSTKSMTGHECWMAGASEIVYSILMMRNHFVAPNINLEHPDEYAERLNLAAHTVDTESFQHIKQNDMKKVFLVMALLMGVVALQAGNPVKLVKGDKGVFLTEATVRVVIDDHKTLIDRRDQTADVYYGAKGADEYAKFVDDVDRAHESFVTYFNEKKRKALLTMTSDSAAQADYTLNVKVTLMNVGNAGGMIWGMSRKAGGAQIEGTMQLVDNATGETKCEFEFAKVKGLMAPVFRARVISVYRYLADGLLKAVEKKK